MVWFWVDDNFATSRKVLSIPVRRRASAIGVWTLAGTWSARQLTDGFVPHYALDEIPDARRRLPDLVSAFLWTPADDGIQFHDWLDYQPSRAKVLAKRAADAARQQAFRDRKDAAREAARNGVTNDASHGVTNSVPTQPNPTQPNRSSYGTTKEEKKPRASARSSKTAIPSTSTKRAEAGAAATAAIINARNNGATPQIGHNNGH